MSLIVDDTSDNQLTVQPTELDFEVTNVGDVGDRGSGYDIASSGQDGSTVVSGSTIFQGEEDLTLTSGDLSPSSFERTAGANEGETLSVPVPTDQPVGSYDDGSGNSFTVETPRIQNLEVTNQNGDDIAGGAVNVDGSTQLTIDAEYNFEQAEPLNVEIEDSGGLEVTDEVLVNPGQEPVISTNGEVTLALAEGVLDNEEYTVTVEGDEDLDFGDASQSVTFDVTTGEDASIEVQSDEVTRGENVKFEVDNAAEGDTHVVSIDADDVDSVPGSVFRNAGDTIATTSTDDGDALALVEIDDGVAVGSIDTSYLDETDVTVDVYGPGEASTQTELEAINDLTEDIGSSVDDDDFTVTEGGVMLENPQGSYVVGSETTVNGTTTAGVDNVALYARDEGDFEYLMTISVDGDDTFEEDDVVLSNPSEGDVANDTLSIPGSYRLAAVDADDSALSTNYRADQNTSAISEAVGMQSSIRVTDTALTVDYVSIVNGQVAVDDDLKINGTAPGQDEVSVSFYGPRGTYDRTTINVDSSDEFESENVDVGDNLGPQLGIDTELSQGNVVMSVFSSGRDGEAGDGQLDGYDSFPDFWTALNTGSNTQQQVIDQVASETTEDTGSDDISEVFQFRYTDGRVSVDSVTGEAGQQFTVETNDTMMVSGVTNRQPDDNTVTVEVIDGPSSSGFDIESTDVWGTDGQWSVEIPVEGVEPGNYTVEASVGGNTDIRSFQVTGEQLEEPTTPDEPTTDEPEPTTDEPEPTT
ncbi:HVO_2072 family ArtA-dependent S-layer glycoprotein, partial [Halorientalis persicus]|uniref:HVO_2072 family ArtA-dependent S-layer glycoprotein n=1 Tax=Halorientalis persicus TaxID=1367881 RepID=UPI00147A9C1F